MEASTKENIIKTLKTYILSKDEDESLEGLKELLIKYPDCLNIDVSKTFIKTDKPFQKIIVIDKKKCIYQISYSDNKIANRWKNVENIPKVVENGILKIFKEKVKVLKHKLIYWENGTHYYKPLPKEFNNREEFLDICQNPEKNIFCVGEAFSQNQGWSEGALESVFKIINKIK